MSISLNLKKYFKKELSLIKKDKDLFLRNNNKHLKKEIDTNIRRLACCTQIEDRIATKEEIIEFIYQVFAIRAQQISHIKLHKGAFFCVWTGGNSPGIIDSSVISGYHEDFLFFPQEKEVHRCLCPEKIIDIYQEVMVDSENKLIAWHNKILNPHGMKDEDIYNPEKAEKAWDIIDEYQKHNADPVYIWMVKII